MNIRKSIRRLRRRDQCQIQGLRPCTFISPCLPCRSKLNLVGIADVKNTCDIDDVLSFTDHTLTNISRGPHPLI
ncbi:unnamed protein product [Rhizophagus irregularis]|nr:unnamed protein product [Rhizophagus irregularis]